MIKMKISAHVKNDRLERMMYIAQNIGWGDIVIQFSNKKNNGSMTCLTDTGIVLIMDPRDNVLITAYVADYPLVKKIYLSNGWTRVPQFIEAKVGKNKKHRQFLSRMYVC